MNVIPAIDLIDGQAVRLTRGDYNKKKVYSDDPIQVARKFEKEGASWVHVVDLDGALVGETKNFEIVKKIVEETYLHVEVGGGVRDMKALDRYMNCGVARVVLGTAALENHDFFDHAVKKYGSSIALGVDVRDGMVAVKGWTEQSEVTLEQICEYARKEGVHTIICTDISRDGMLKGANLAMYDRLARLGDIDIVASGGVATLKDVFCLRHCGMSGVILGKALYEERIDLHDAFQVAGGPVSKAIFEELCDDDYWG